MRSDSTITNSQDIPADYRFDTDSRSIDPQQGSELSSRTEDTPKPHSQIIIVGTAHVSEKSVNQVVDTIERERPDVVAVELCRGRYEGLKGKTQDSAISIRDLLGEGKIYFFLVHWLLAYIQKKIGNEMGVQPGAEMIAAIDAAEAVGAKVALIDRDIQVTLQRFWGKMRFTEKIRMVGSLLGAALGIGGGEEIDMDTITEQDTVTMLIEELRKIAPTAATVLIDERDAYIAGNLVNVAAGGGRKIVAVVGAGHKGGIKKYLEDPGSIPPLSSITDVPKKRFGLMKFLGIGIVGIALATFLLLILSGTPIKLLLIAFGWWFIINGVLSAIGTVIARGHPYSVLTAFSVAWLTSLNPMMAAGWFAGLMEAKQRNPTTADFKKLVEIESTEDMFKNNFFRVVLVAALANIGSMIGTFLGVWMMVEVTGINPLQLITDAFGAGMMAIGL